MNVPLAFIESLINTLEAKDPYTKGHSSRVSRLGFDLGKALRLSDRACEEIRLVGLFHDIGKIGVPDTILFKEGPLTGEEFQHIRRHPVISSKIIEPLDPECVLTRGVLHHHENWDGTGYPFGIAREKIPLSSAVIRVVDSYDAMTSKRSYRDCLSKQDAADELIRNKGRSYHPDLVEGFLELMGLG